MRLITPAFCLAVPVVVSTAAEPKVSRIDAASNVAAVAYVHARGDWADKYLVGVAVSPDEFPTCGLEPPIAVLGEYAEPNPAPAF